MTFLDDLPSDDELVAAFEALVEVAEAVRAMQVAYRRIETGDDPDEEAAFVAFYAEAVGRVLALELPEVNR